MKVYEKRRLDAAGWQTLVLDAYSEGLEAAAKRVMADCPDPLARPLVPRISRVLAALRLLIGTCGADAGVTSFAMTDGMSLAIEWRHQRRGHTR